jgi:hypothetical protein
VTAPDETILRCRRGPHCADTRRHTTTQPDGSTTASHEPAWATTPDGLCRMDTTLALRAIEQLPRDYLELGILLGKTSRSLDAPTGGTRELPVPIRLSVEALQAEILWELAIWASAVAEQSGFTFVEAGRHHHRVRYAAGWLTGRWPALLTLPVTAVVRLDGKEERQSGRSLPVGTEEDGVNGALRLLHLHEQVTFVEGRTHRAHQLWSPCPRCQTLALCREEGSPHVDCGRCGHRMNMDQYDQLAGVLAVAYGAEAAP